MTFAELTEKLDGMNLTEQQRERVETVFCGSNGFHAMNLAESLVATNRDRELKSQQ